MLMRRALSRLGVMLGTMVVLLLVVEVVARATYTPMLGEDFELDPWVGFNRLATKGLGPLGFREDPLDKAVFDEGVTRILLLGDSFTFGWGVESPADRFSDLVEARLNRERRGRYHVYNAGISGSFPDDWCRALIKLLPRYRPHLVLAVFFLRDGTSLSTSLLYHRQRIKQVKAKYDVGFWSRHSGLVAAITDRLASRELTEWYLDQFSIAYLGTSEERQVWTDMQGWLAQIQRRCAKQKIPFHMAIFPLLFDLDDYAYGAVEDEIVRFATGEQIPIMSLTPGFLGREARDLWVSPADQHPNERGHAIAGDTLYPYLDDVLNGMGR